MDPSANELLEEQSVWRNILDSYGPGGRVAQAQSKEWVAQLVEWKEKAREQRKEQRKNMSGERQQCSDLRSDLAYTLPLEASGKTTEDSLLKTIKRIEGSVKGIEAKMRDKHAAYAQSVLPQFIITLPCTDGVRPVAKNYFLYEDFAMCKCELANCVSGLRRCKTDALRFPSVPTFNPSALLTPIAVASARHGVSLPASSSARCWACLRPGP